MNASENMPNKDQMIAKDQKMHIFLPIMQKISWRKLLILENILSIKVFLLLKTY